MVDKNDSRIRYRSKTAAHRLGTCRQIAILSLFAILSIFRSAAASDKKAIVPKAGDVLENSLGMELAYCPAGEFRMGSAVADESASNDEVPQSRVILTQGFYLGRTEVTQGQWKAVMDTEPWKGKKRVREGANYPATYLTWQDAVSFCEALSKKEGRTYQLPTEAQWEYACRAGTTTRYSFGDDATDLKDFAWWGAHAMGNTAAEPYAHQVGQKKANPWGLHDMHGNIVEWCQDSYDEAAYAERRDPIKDPVVTTAGAWKIARGGSWNYYAGPARSAARQGKKPSALNSFTGFRVVLVP